jgi:hypothetical protein
MARRQLIQRKRTPLILICTEGGKGSAEYNYFRNYKTRNLRIEFATGNSTDPKGMLSDLKKYINNEDVKSEDNCRIFLVIDTDLSESRINEIKEISSECNELNIEIITSSPTFEIWYLMHYRNNGLTFSSSKAVKKELEKIIKEPYYANTNVYKNIKDLTYIAKDTALSIERQCQKNNCDLIKANPHSLIYKILETIDEFNNIK